MNKKTTVYSWFLLGLAVMGLWMRGFADAVDSYVEFGGTVHVDTGYYVSGQTAVVADFQLVDTTTAQQLVWSAGNEMWNRLYVNGWKQWAWSCKDDSGNTESTGINVSGDRLVATVDGFNNRVTLVKDGVVLYSYTGSWSSLPHTKTCTTSLKIGSRFLSGGSGWCHAKMKLYGFKIYEAGVLVRDYVPATRDGVIGLYDRVNGGFAFDARAPLADHQLTAVGELVEINDAYVESDGSSGMNARIPASGDLRAEVDFAYTDFTQQQRAFGMDSRPSLYINNADCLSFSVGTNATACHSGLQADACRHTAVIDNANRRVCIYTGTAVAYKGDMGAAVEVETTSPRPFSLFANTDHDTGLKFRHTAKVRIYGAKFYRANVLVHDYQPCVKGGVAGFRDRVDGVFICGENAYAFTAGGPVERLSDDGYVSLAGNNQSTGGTTKWIDTGYCPGPTTRFTFDYALATNYTGVVSTNKDDNGDWYFLWAYTADRDALPAERLYFFGNRSCTFAWRNGADSTDVPYDSDVAPTTQRDVRRRIAYDAASKTYALVTSGFTNFVAVSDTTLTRTFDKSLRIGCFGDSAQSCFAPLKVYGLKIYEGDELVRDFRPEVTNGLAGLRDVVTGAFAGNSGQKNLLSCGGSIASDVVSKDAYLELDGRQSFDTGILMTPNHAVVCDFQLTDTRNIPQQFVWSSPEYCCRLYTDGYGTWSWFCHNSGIGGVATGLAPDNTRFTATADGYNGKVIFVRNGETWYEKKVTGSQAGTCTSTLKIGSRFAEGANGWNGTWMRLYSFKVYDSGALVRDYVPYRQNGVAGLWEKVGGTFLADSRNVAAPTISGRGATIASTVADATIASGGAKTFAYSASGAVSYKWYLNGEEIAGETGTSCSLAWRKPGAAPTDVLSVRPVYSLFGEETLGESVSASVTYGRRGLIFVVR